MLTYTIIKKIGSLPKSEVRKKNYKQRIKASGIIDEHGIIRNDTR